MPRICRFVVGFVALALGSVPVRSQDERPDIVFVIVDDLNDWLGCLGGHPAAVSPHIDALAAEGMLFTQAYCNAPQCRPSRTSLNHGVLPIRTGTYFNLKAKNESSIDTPTMQEFFAEQGYRVASGGKVFHGGPGRFGDALLARPADPKPPRGQDRFDASGTPDDGYALDVDDEAMGDHKVATWAIEQWQTPSDEPLFLSVGFFRPHRPLQVPAPWFERFPVEGIQRPAEPVEGDDWDDMPEFARMLARSHAHKALHGGLSDHESMVERGTVDATIRAYQASVAFVDRQIGRLIDSLADNPRGRETVVMLVSDHGWHLGEKKHWCKAAIWEQTTHIPFIVRGPGVPAGARCTQPVSLIDVFPSLVDFAGLEKPEWLDGTSIRAQLEDPTASRPPVICSYGADNTAVRDEHWRYIRYEDGSEELYDHRVDPDEWTNLALDPAHDATKARLAGFLPKAPHPGLRVQDWFDKHQK
ncbi:MAG: sulfatase [Planctomycetota bacterium]|nr:sulfatase [Planctomycetota bacterium]MDA0934342.1 sulfatase [Planctomycetota bacterium]